MIPLITDNYVSTVTNSSGILRDAVAVSFDAAPNANCTVRTDFTGKSVTEEIGCFSLKRMKITVINVISCQTISSVCATAFSVGRENK